MILGTVWTIASVVLLSMSTVNPIAVTPPLKDHVVRLSGGLPSGSGLPGHLPDDHIQHVIAVMMENHDYDSYFGTYCQQLGPYCSSTGNGIPAGTCIPMYPAYPYLGCIAPFNFTPAQFLISDMAHDSYSGATAYDGGAMDGFYQAEGTNYSFGHYNQATIPIYWDMAEQYAISDNFWGANLSWSLPNHWYWLAGSSPPEANTFSGGWSGWDPTYLDQANQTRTIEDVLNGSNVSWKYYDFPLMSSYSSAASTGGIWGTAYDIWSPFAGRAISYTSAYSSHFVWRSHLLTDLQQGTLPNISWVIPDLAYTDHPGWNNSNGEGWFAQLVNAVENSSYWNSTAIFITWDEYGGFYEHVSPRTIFSDRLDFRSPIIVISPYAKENYISHAPGDFMSILRFIEWQFGLGCLSPLDCLAPLPLDFFDFNQTARAPILFPTFWGNATYPMPLQQLAPLNLACTECLRTTPGGWEMSDVLPSPYIDPD